MAWWRRKLKISLIPTYDSQTLGAITSRNNSIENFVINRKFCYIECMSAKKTKYLSYIEETRRHHKIIEKVAEKSVKKAISNSLDEDIPITYLEGDKIIQENSQGEKVILGSVENNIRKVKVGATSELPEE